MFNWQSLWKWDVHQCYWEFWMQLQRRLWARAHDELWRQVILFFSIISSWYRKCFSCLSFYLYYSDVLLMIIFITNIFFFISVSLVTKTTLKPLSDNSSILVLSELASVAYLFPWDWVTFSWFLSNFGLCPGYCEWGLLESVILFWRILTLLS